MVRMRLNLDDRRSDPSGVDDPPSAVDVDVGEAYRSTKSVVDKGFHRCPGFLQRDPAVVYDRSERIARILVVAGFEGERRVHQVEVHRIETESAKTRLQCGFHTFGSVVVVPQLRGHEQVL